jgi:hypothetical protein
MHNKLETRDLLGLVAGSAEAVRDMAVKAITLDIHVPERVPSYIGLMIEDWQKLQAAYEALLAVCMPASTQVSRETEKENAA